MPIEEEEYELVPVGPIRKMEKRIERIERSGTSNDMVKELIDVVRTNQKIVDEVVKINTEMINRVSQLAEHVQQLTGKVNDFLERVEIGGGESVPAAQEESSPETEQRIQKLEKRINSLLLSTMKTKQLHPQMVKRPMPV